MVSASIGHAPLRWQRNPGPTLSQPQDRCRRDGRSPRTCRRRRAGRSRDLSASWRRRPTRPRRWAALLMASDLPRTQVSSHMKRSPLSFTNRKGPWNGRRPGMHHRGGRGDPAAARRPMLILWPSPWFTRPGVLAAGPRTRRRWGRRLPHLRLPPMSPGRARRPWQCVVLHVAPEVSQMQPHTLPESSFTSCTAGESNTNSAPSFTASR